MKVMCRSRAAEETSPSHSQQEHHDPPRKLRLWWCFCWCCSFSYCTDNTQLYIEGAVPVWLLYQPRRNGKMAWKNPLQMNPIWEQCVKGAGEKHNTRTSSGSSSIQLPIWTLNGKTSWAISGASPRLHKTWCRSRPISITITISGTLWDNNDEYEVGGNWMDQMVLLIQLFRDPRLDVLYSIPPTIFLNNFLRISLIKILYRLIFSSSPS